MGDNGEVALDAMDRHPLLARLIRQLCKAGLLSIWIDADGPITVGATHVRPDHRRRRRGLREREYHHQLRVLGRRASGVPDRRPEAVLPLRRDERRIVTRMPTRCPVRGRESEGERDCFLYACN
jgi:hypothetical protein